MDEGFQIRIHGDEALPTLVYLPGLHGDWTLITAFRTALEGRVRLVEISYPDSLTGSIEEYAGEINDLLLLNRISSGWLLGESFGSQVAWGLLDAMAGTTEKGVRFRAEGLILAAGFVKHFWKWGPRFMLWIGEITPMWLYRLELKMLECSTFVFHWNELVARQSVREFVLRRTELNRRAMRHRLIALDAYDSRPVAKQARLPVFYLGGLLYPLVPGFQVCHWLKKNCPGYKGGKILWLANHVVLNSSAKRAANIAVQWMKMPLSE